MAERLIPERKPVPLTESQRVVNLPMRPFEHEERHRLAERLTRELSRPGGTFQLRPIQAAALEELAKHGGLVAPIGVGHGKTLIALLAGTVLRAELTVILAPASTVKQLHKMREEMAKHFHLPENIRIYSYASLSKADNSDLLERLAARYKDGTMLIVADEAHRLKRREAARTKRIIRFFQAHPEVRFAALSGTFTSRSITEFTHLSELALRHKSPLPMDRYHLNHWAGCIDVDGQPGARNWEIVRPLWEWYAALSSTPSLAPITSYRGQERNRLIRDAFRHRLWSTPGVVATSSDSALGSSLYFRLLSTPGLPDKVQSLRDLCLQRGELPHGEILEDGVAQWRFRRQMSQGFYYVWDWPGEPDTEWLAARRDWGRRVRAELLRNAEEGYDSPLLVFNRIAREHAAGARRVIHLSWERWKGQKQKDPPPTKPIWLSDYLIDFAQEWLDKSKDPGIVWVDTKAVADRLRERGITVFGAGETPSTVAAPCAMSIAAHGVGKNLQAWRTQLVLSPPSGGQTWEQLLGRLHRQGQQADEVACQVMHNTPAFAQAWQSAHRDARYIQASTGNPQKLLYGMEIQ